MRLKVRLIRPDCKNVILMQAKSDLCIPYAATSELVRIASLGHEHIAGLKCAA